MSKSPLFVASILVAIAACSAGKMPTTPTSAEDDLSVPLAHSGHAATTALADNPHSAAHDAKGYIDGWFRGERVQLYYTKSSFVRIRQSGCGVTTDGCALALTPRRHQGRGQSPSSMPSRPPVAFSRLSRRWPAPRAPSA